jgi:hypothetical protein
VRRRLRRWLRLKPPCSFSGVMVHRCAFRWCYRAAQHGGERGDGGRVFDPFGQSLPGARAAGVLGADPADRLPVLIAQRRVGGLLVVGGGLSRAASPPLLVTVGDCPRPRPRRGCGLTRAGAREAWTRQPVTSGPREGRRSPGAGRRARPRARSAPPARPARAHAVGSRPSCGPCRRRPSGRPPWLPRVRRL